eukprot:CAMPEP_0117760382 /NCGR_PEP_ID=MMETSP0947-20121206/16595_1 /TAXON_ID=44440 /ORGANISM="Chattonella subsalsa, Strain CCMP2191" /LENGTH=158 /DNA_ID=CAMNT_0005581059 /DNA_START=33 /DNA_END=509 /DNA_ORIENTATION=+
MSSDEGETDKFGEPVDGIDITEDDDADNMMNDDVDEPSVRPDVQMDPSFAEVPEGLSGLRACKRCTLVKTYTQFYEHGCDNCPFLEMDANPDRVNDCTSSFFEGLIAMVQPEGSWVAKWQRIGQCKPGMYAIEVIGEFPNHILQYLESKNISVKAKPG